MPIDASNPPTLAAGDAEAIRALARATVAEAHLPPFVAHTAAELLAMLDRALREQAADPVDSAAFWAALEEVLGDLDACLAFGHEVLSEELDAQSRVEAITGRLGGRALHPMLEGPVADLMETLDAMRHRLDAGLYPLADFHHAFDEVCTRVETLLAWQAALDDRPGSPAIAPLGA
ncbi:MAG: hypothetical protein ACK46X_08900 [Candidatus Sericytochromatia bacterium]